MSTFPPPTALEASGYLRGWGPAYRTGVVSDHVYSVQALPGTRVVEGDLATWVVDDQAGGRAYPVLCGDLVEWMTEDGPTDGRCGLLATDEGACEGHAAESRQWREMSEAERARWERDREGAPR